MTKNELYVASYRAKLKKKGWIPVASNESLEMRLNLTLETVHMKITEIINQMTDFQAFSFE